MIPLWIAAEVTKALAEQGFVSGRYGDVPYDLEVSATVTEDDGSHVDIIHAWIYLDKRKAGAGHCISGWDCGPEDRHREVASRYEDNVRSGQIR